MSTFRNCDFLYNPDFRFSDDNCPVLIEGAECIETLCPVSSLTGHRTNALTLLGMVTDSNARLLDNILQVLPSVQELNVPDDVKIDMLVPSDYGSFAERDAVLKRLADVSDVLFRSASKSEDSIKFDAGDSPSDVVDHV